MAKKKKKTAKKKKAKAATKKLDSLKPEVTPHPTAGRKVVDFEEKLDQQLSGQVPESPKRGPGRPRKEQEPEPEQIGDEIVKAAVCVPFDMWARSQQLSDLKLTKQEADMITGPVKTLLDYYLPQLPAIAIAWASLIVGLYTITVPRLDLIAELRNKKSSSQPGREASVNETSLGSTQGHGGPRVPVGFPLIGSDDLKSKKVED